MEKKAETHCRSYRRHLSSSGDYWRDGIIVSAAHTMRRAEDISVILPSGQRAAATFAGADPSTDVALLKISKSTYVMLLLRSRTRQAREAERPLCGSSN